MSMIGARKKFACETSGMFTRKSQGQASPDQRTPAQQKAIDDYTASVLRAKLEVAAKNG
ncbi:MAG: hypothetical protein AAFQ81_09315 [Pseudomonadota bacterium]